jgi:hypothetical protein
MNSNKKIILALIVMAGTAAFSTASISTMYFQTVRTSALVCQKYSSAEGTLDYENRGVINNSRTENVQANCPVNLGPAEGSYRIDVVAFARNSGGGKTVTCKLLEIDSLSGTFAAKYQNSVYVSNGSAGLLTWRDIEARTPESVFTLNCDLPPKHGLISISVTEEI